MKLPIAKIVTQEEDGVVLDIALPSSLAAFDGHFPGYPVLPGVVQVDWVMRLSAERFGLGAVAASDVRIKFRRIISPDMPLALHLQIMRARNRLIFSYVSGGTEMSSGQIQLGG
jgi:3-hydroxyacyl-[acyl-carrier-protein] dehydratase